MTYNHEVEDNMGTYSVKVTVSDRKDVDAADDTTADTVFDDTITVTITVEDVNEGPTFTAADGETLMDNVALVFTVAENTASNVNIEPEQANGPVVKATDPDTEEEWNTLTYGFKNSSDAALFTIDAASGQLTTNADLDHETQRDYEVIVTVSDGVANEAPDDPDDTIRVIIRVTNDTIDDVTGANMIPYFNFQGVNMEGDGLLTDPHGG